MKAEVSFACVAVSISVEVLEVVRSGIRVGINRTPGADDACIIPSRGTAPESEADAVDCDSDQADGAGRDLEPDPTATRRNGAHIGAGTPPEDDVATPERTVIPPGTV